jgi:hypothetical protein
MPEQKKKSIRKLCEIAVHTGEFLLAWVGIPEEESGIVKPAFWYGDRADYLTAIESISYTWIKIQAKDRLVKPFELVNIIIVMMLPTILACCSGEQKHCKGIQKLYWIAHQIGR